MKKAIISIAFCIVSSWLSYGASGDHFRNSLTFVSTEDNTCLRSAIELYVKRAGRYDYNNINTKTVSSINVSTLDKVAREVLLCWFPGGDLTDDSVIIARSRHNATDQDVRVGKSAKIGSGVYDQTYELINHSYVVFVTPCTNERHPSGVSLKLSVYKLSVSIEDLFDYKNAAAYPNAKLVFENSEMFSFHMAMSGLDETERITRCMLHCLEEALGGNGSEAGAGKLSSELSRVTGTIITAFPVTQAKLGVKQSVKNGDRFKVVVHSEKTKGQITTSTTGYLRAATIRDNRGIADGDSPVSNFYRISGKAPVGSTIISESNKPWSISLGIGKYYTGNYLDYDEVYGQWRIYSDNIESDPAVFLSARRLLHINRIGFSHYFLVESWLLFSNLSENGIFDSEVGGDLSIGYGLGLRIAHVFEAMPFVKVGVTSEIYDLPVVLRAGARLSVNFHYPIGLYAQFENFDFIAGQSNCLLSFGVHLWY